MSKTTKIQNLIVSDNIRAIVKNTLTEIVKDKELASKIEGELQKNKSMYLKNLSKIIVFSDSKHYIGQFANIFREKLNAGVYTPKRLIELEVTEMLPEVFLNSVGTDYTKLDIYQNIDKALEQEGELIVANWQFLIDPSKKMPTKPSGIAINEGKVTKLIEKTSQDTRELCSNENWDIKSTNMIICKEGGKFYCLNIEKLIKELADKNTATNYITGQALDAEIVTNIRNRYEAQINSLKEGKSVELGTWTEKDILHLKKVLKGLKDVKKAGTNENKVKEILASLPPIGKEHLNDKTIEQIEAILAKVSEEKKEEVAAPVAASQELLEIQVVKYELLKPGTLAKKLVDSYINQLENLQESISKNIYKVTDVTIRGEYQAKLNEISNLLANVKKESVTFDGIIKYLEDELKRQNAILAGFNSTIGMNIIFATEKLVAQQEVLALKNYVEKLGEELEYVKKAKKTFLDKL